MDLIESYQELSIDATIDDETTSQSFLQKLSESDLEKLKVMFQSKVKDGKNLGLNKEEFLDVICTLYENSEYSHQALMLFDNIKKNYNKSTIVWEDFVDALVQNVYSSKQKKLSLSVVSLDTVSHGKNESIAKIVLIETKNYFCYAIILKHGRVGLYDGNLNFLTSYYAILTREDISKPEDERRRRNRWVTDAIFCSDILMFMIVTTARSLIIYEASGLKHVPYWLILSTPNILQCLSYKSYQYSEKGTSTLFAGDDNGEVTSFIFLQPKNGILKRKRTDNISIFYWEDFLKQKSHVQVNQYGKVHQNAVINIQYDSEIDSLITCSRYAEYSVIIKHIGNKKKSTVFKMNRGASCFALSVAHKILITGSDDGVIRLWNPVLNSKPVGILSDHQCDVLDIKILKNQEMFLSCSKDGILKLWDLKEQICLQTIRLKFPPFKVQGKFIEWGISCIYPGPKRRNPEFRSQSDQWERSNLLVTCNNYIATIRLNFSYLNVEYSFSFPILTPPPLQSSVLIPSDWRFEAEKKTEETPMIEMGYDVNVNLRKELNNLKFILEKDLFCENGAKSNINYKIAILESKKEKMMEKVAQGAPYLALDIFDITELKLSEDVPHPKRKKNQQIFQRIKSMLDDATSRNQIFSEPSSSRSKSSGRSSVVEFPFY